MTENICMHCTFWKTERNSEYGECRRFPPVALPFDLVERLIFENDVTGDVLLEKDNLTPAWAATSYDDWCGEFKKKETPAVSSEG